MKFQKGMRGILHALVVVMALAVAAPAAAETRAILGPASLADREAPAEAFESKVPVERIADEFARDMFWLGAGLSADLLSTSWALRECPSCYEANPFGHDSEARIALKIGTASAIGLTQYRLRRAGHHGWATALRWFGVFVQGGFTVNNSLHALRGK